jgi:hypothetical protein
MALQAERETRTLREWLVLTIEWAQSSALSVAGRLNQERWTNLVIILGVVSANLIVLGSLLQGENIRAIAFGIIILTGLFALRYCEVSITIFITVGTGLFVNTFWYAGQGTGTGQRAFLILFLIIVTIQAAFEYVRTAKEDRPRIWTPLTFAVLLFWLYHLAHVLYIYLFLYDVPPADDVMRYMGISTTPLFRYFDAHMVWIGILPIMILLRDWKRAQRVIIALCLIMIINVFAIIWEYFSPLPQFFKIMFQLRAAGETPQGYRVRDPFGLYFSMTLFFGLLYLLGYIRGFMANLVILLYTVAYIMVLLITKNRILWAGVMVFLPLVLLWKPPAVLLRQAVVLGIALLVFTAFMLHPSVYAAVSQIVNETVERWSLNYAYGGDPRLDPSYQFRAREREAWEHTYERLGVFQRVFGAGLEAPYGFFLKSSTVGEYAHLPYTIYFEKVGMHFAWLGRLLRYGWVGTTLLAMVLIIFFARAVFLFFKYSNPIYRAIIMALIGATIGVLAFDSLHMILDKYAAASVVLMWSLLELIPHWSNRSRNEGYHAAANL